MRSHFPLLLDGKSATISKSIATFTEDIGLATGWGSTNPASPSLWITGHWVFGGNWIRGEGVRTLPRLYDGAVDIGFLAAIGYGVREDEPFPAFTME